MAVSNVKKLYTAAVMTIMSRATTQKYKNLNTRPSPLDQPNVGWYDRTTRCAKIRFTMNSSNTPACVKMLAAMAMFTLRGTVAQPMRRHSVVMRAMQKPKMRIEKMNLWSRLRLTWKMNMCVAAAIR